MDLFTFEIIRHRLFSIVEEAIITLKHVSGTIASTEGQDIMVSLYDADGSLATGGVGFLHHLLPAAEACKLIVDRFKGDIHPGDVFMVNDPYLAALHTSDVFIVRPIYCKDELVAWTACFVHVYDIGGTNVGGFCVDARSVYDDGFFTRGLKLVSRGEFRLDVVDTFINMTRVPEMVALDLASMIACTDTAQQRLIELMEKYGVAAVQTVTRQLQETSDRQLRARLRELPDGRWQSRQYMTIQDETYRIYLTLTKKDDTLEFDFTGSSPQSKYSINCSYLACVGGLFAPLYPLLCHDMVWNDGLRRAIKVIAPEGTVCNAPRPTPTSCATVCAIEAVNNVACHAINKMLLASDVYSATACANWHGNLHACFVFGKNNEGQDLVGVMTETLAGAMGARSHSDGVDMGGQLPNPICRMSNVELTESLFPIRYLFRRRLRDSAGAGKYRGGAGLEYAIVAHDAPYGMDYVSVSKGVDFPVSEGQEGGYPGAPNSYTWFKSDGSDRKRRFAQSCEDMGEQGVSAVWGTYPLRNDDILHVRSSGGGGFGDPLTRDPQAVLLDVQEGLVSLEVARDVFGTVFEDDNNAHVDVTRTEEARKAVRDRRLSSAKRPLAATRLPRRKPGGPKAERLSEALVSFQSGSGTDVCCRECGETLGAGDSPTWKTRVGAIERSARNIGGAPYTTGEKVVIREFICSSCGTMLEVETAHADDPHLLASTLQI
jgi:N-methylhydantoinase B